MFRTLIVDDEPLAQQELQEHLEKYKDFQIIGTCSNAIEAIKVIHHDKVDVVFLDIQMPRINGLELVGMLDPEKTPRIVFLTAHDEYAIRAFEEHAFDYLLKPVDPARLEKTIQQLRRDRPAIDMTALPEVKELKAIPCTGVSRIYLLRLDEVESISTKSGGVYVTDLEGKDNFTELTLRTLETRTPFLRCHRQHLVNPNQIREIRFVENNQAEIVTLKNRHLPVSRRFLGALQNKIGLN